METKALQKWAELLLDMGKRNNLINFKNTQQGTAEIIAPDALSLFRQIGHTSVFEVYDPKLETDDEDIDRVVELAADEVVETNLDMLATPEVRPQTAIERYLALYEKKLKKGQVLLYNESGKPLSALKNISKKARSAMEETGVNILYLTFGFIHWTEAEHSGVVMKAPLLLVPVSIENDSALEPFRIKVSDDDIIVNPTFSFKLQKEFNIQLPPYDEEEDVEIYFQRVEKLLSKIKWTVSCECKLGLFSFLKINMYQDIVDNAETIVRSPNICAMMGEEQGQANGEDAPDFDLMELHNVVDADSSQSEAIEMAKRGGRFVLQGPPGTGKSQTITNIIAECLSDGKSVLFVSEKLAALSVVYDKLKKAGLEEFCLELHSHKANKKQVIDELCRTLKKQRSALSGRAKRELDIKREAQHKLDTYATELHTVRPGINKSLYQLYSLVSGKRKAPDLEFAIPCIQDKGETYVDEATIALERYVEYIPTIGYDYRQNVWYGFDAPDVSYSAKMQIRSDLQSTTDLSVALQAVAEDLRERYEMDMGDLADTAACRRFFALARESRYISPLLFTDGTVIESLPIAEQLKEFAEIIRTKKAYLDERYDADVYNLEAATLYKKLTRQFSSIFSRLFSSEYRELMKEIRLCYTQGSKLNYRSAVEDMDALCLYKDAMEAFQRMASNPALFGPGYCGVDTDFEALLHEWRTLSEIDDMGMKYGGLGRMTTEEFMAEQANFAAVSAAVDGAFATYGDASERLLAQFNKAYVDLTRIPLSDLQQKCEGCLASMEQVDNWWEFVKLQKKIEHLELEKILHFMLERKITPDQMVDAYHKAFYTQWVDAVMHASPIFLEFARIPHDEAVRRFREKDTVNFEINKAIIRANVSAKRPSLDMVAQGSAIAILLREGEKKRKQKSVRQLLSEIGDLALTIKPCFLMSPLSVSTFLSADMQFDVVVFDEASQIFPQDAIGAIYRGKQLIVVGDSKQMPPSDFFNASSSGDDDRDDSEDEDITDFESILDLCSISFPQRRLKWHYRSRYEELISFSNKNYYDNELISFPSAKVSTEGAGVDYYYVEGTFDRQSKTNRAEAERVVDLVFENFEKYPDQSLGVVAFSVSQQTLIEKLIAKRRQTDRSKEAFFKSDLPEPFFVKNLETVQGDERDRIIFSIAYAKDAQGKFYLNFGPINRVGGERRLNVAVTRAKRNVQLVTSMHATDIDLSRTQAVGARLLREYLDYAEHGAIALQRTLNVTEEDSYDSEFEMEVCEFLRENGYEVDTRVGCSTFKIDMALKRPDSSDYLLAIECDGASYHSSKTARDRDRLRQSILENMGWKFYRIWSTDWFRNNRVEKERLLEAVKEAVEQARIREAVAEEAPPCGQASCNQAPCEQEAEEGTTRQDVVEEVCEERMTTAFEETAEEKHFAFPVYKEASVSALQAMYNGDVTKIVKAILKEEAPVSEEWLLKRLVHLYGREKVNRVVKEAFEAQMSGCERAGIIRRNGYMYLKGKDTFVLRVPSEGSTPREIKYIAPEELAAGLRELLKQNISAEKKGLFKLLAQYLGFSRTGDAILAKFEEALALIGDEIETSGDMISLK